MALNLDTLRAELNAVELAILDLHLVEKQHGAAAAFPALADAIDRRMKLRGHIEQLEQAARDAAHAAHVSEGVAVLQAAYAADPVTHPAAEAILAHVATSPDTLAVVPAVVP